MFSAILTGLSALFQGIATLLGMSQAKEQRNEGAQDQRLSTDDATLKTLEAVSALTSIAARDKLWDDNAKKFGPDGGKTGG